jgi:hypothetical protein
VTQEIYQIRVKGHLDVKRSSWFDGLAINHTSNGETLLTGPLLDQAALYSVLLKMHNLGLPLLAVQRSSSTHNDTQTKPEKKAIS